jgi:molecular chaperone HscB
MKKIQQVLHPDRFGNKSEEEQGVSQSLSSFVNEAISTLQNPIERGLYLLKLRGIEIDLEKQLTLDTEFLGEVMELNEKLEEISNSQDWIDFRTANERELEVLETKLTKAFERDNTKEAQLILSQMKYFENLQLKLKEIQSKFNVVD